MKKGKIVSTINGKKQCTFCERMMNVSEFRKRIYPSGTISFRQPCSLCVKQYQRREARLKVLSIEQKEKKAQYMKKYYKDNKERLSKVNKNRAWGWYHSKGIHRYQKPEWRFKTYETSANRSGREFSITKVFFLELIKNECFYCGEKKEPRGLDRVDNLIGYIEPNVVACCKRCNFMKRSMSQDIFLKQCHLIAKKQDCAQ